MSKDLIENIAPEGYQMRGVYTPAKKIDLGEAYLIFVSGVQPHKDEDHNVTTNDIEEQTEQVFQDISKILSAAGASLDDVVKAVIHVTNMDEFDKVSEIRAKYFQNSKPASTLLEVKRLTRNGARIEIEVTAIVHKV